ncbi:hypothetical protein LJR225_001569 [Phenylobacterium sp. LjRoot225]|uniref:hypothetical protein n=1 Tax=Phenylobacterium sp. LjRoot225 TaxID=3342285 RepID=UPI003ECF8889
MTTLTEIVATVVVHSSAAALSHFGVTLEPAPTARSAPPHVVERVIARTPRAPEKLASCPKPRTVQADLRA